MLHNLSEDLFLSQKINIKRIYSNKELYLHQYFVKIVKINPISVFIYNNIVFFFVKSEDYFKAKYPLGILKKRINKKVLIIRAEKSLIKLIYSFFPDVYIHNINFNFNKISNEKTITIELLSFQERGIAIGRNGDYINAVNEIFRRFVNFEVLDDSKVKIQAKYVKL